MEVESPAVEVAEHTRRLLREGVALAAAMGLTDLHATDRRALALLDELNEHGQASPSALADRLGLTRAAVTSVVDRLAAAGLVERRPSVLDRRRTDLVVTAEARALGAEHLRPWAERIAAASADLTPEQARTVRDYLAAVLDRP